MGDLPAVMPAAVYRAKGDVVVEERPVPAPEPDQVLLEVSYCGICGSDIHILLEGWGDTPGLIAGHEYAGTIVALGRDVEGWQIGEAVVGGPSPRCGHCRRCLEGKPSQCENRRGSAGHFGDGAFARYILVRAAALVRVPEGVSPRHAALAEPLAVALHGITRSGVKPGDRVLVIGAGPIGALSIAALRAMDITDVVAVEPGERRRKLAADLGATDVWEPGRLERFPPWEPERLADPSFHVVLECSGKKAAMEAGFYQLARGGTLALVGAGIEGPSFDPNRFVLNELSVCGSFIYDADGFEHALGLLARPDFPADLLIEAEDVTLDQLSDTLVDLAEGRLAGKVMVVPRVAAASSSGGAR
jgi:(R,R)-butanediol dehydrogenase / meso-butanediol dehydrogenase / diacetyl reductase